MTEAGSHAQAGRPCYGGCVSAKATGGGGCATPKLEGQVTVGAFWQSRSRPPEPRVVQAWRKSGDGANYLGEAFRDVGGIRASSDRKRKQPWRMAMICGSGGEFTVP